MKIEDRPVRADRLRKLPGGEAAAERLLRRRQLEAREVAVHRQARVQKIVAWNAASGENLPQADAGAGIADGKRGAHFSRARRGARPVAAAHARETRRRFRGP